MIKSQLEISIRVIHQSWTRKIWETESIDSHRTNWRIQSSTGLIKKLGMKHDSWNYFSTDVMQRVMTNSWWRKLRCSCRRPSKCSHPYTSEKTVSRNRKIRSDEIRTSWPLDVRVDTSRYHHIQDILIDFSRKISIESSIPETTAKEIVQTIIHMICLY